MGAEETAKDLLLKRIQVTVAILAGVATLILGVYNVKKNVFSDNGPGRLAITVRSDAGTAVGNAKIELFNSQNALAASSESRGDGSYGQDDIDPGSYSLRISAAGFEPQILAVQIAPKKTANFQIVLKRSSQAPGSHIRSALEEVGASWLQDLKKPKAETREAN